MLDDDLFRELLSVFADEAREHLEAINRHLLNLESGAAGEPEGGTERLLAEIFREAHSLKGAARAVNLEEIEMLAHRMENLFGRWKSGELQPAREQFDRVYQALDAIGLLVEASTGGETATVDVAGILRRLEEIGQAPDGKEQAEQPAPPPSAAPGRGSDHRNPAASDSYPPPQREQGRQAEETIRVATAKLDALMAEVSELRVTLIGTEQRRAEIMALAERIEKWEAWWRKVRPQYRRLLSAVEVTGTGRRTGTEDRNTAPHFQESAPLLELLEFLEANETSLRAARAQVWALRRKIESDERRLGQVTAALEESARRIRMLPISTVFDAFPRMVRDLAHDLGKAVTLRLDGGSTEVDRSILEQIKAPLTHLLRNAVDHGIEPREARLAAGKPPEGTITLTAAQRGDSLTIEVADDGAGIDLAKVRASAISRGLVTAEVAESLSDRETLWLIFRSGLSTNPFVTDISGRGVGLDVVRENIERLHGMIHVESRPGEGTRFSLNLPLTVATTLCLLVQSGGRPFALPINSVVRIVQISPDDVGLALGRRAIRIDGHPVALADLSEVLGIAPSPAAGPAQKPGKRPAVVLGPPGSRVAFIVDALIGTQELVTHSLPRPLIRVRHIVGATILGTGEVVLILNAVDLLRSAGQSHAHPSVAPAAPSEIQTRRPVILVVDDSITTRTLEKNILEAAGYEVRVAADGVEAWTLLQSEGCDLVISDVNMPRMDGFELTSKIRADQQWKDLPVILVTALQSREDRERGIAVGADAYVVKSAFDQETLLEAIRRLI